MTEWMRSLTKILINDFILFIYDKHTFRGFIY